MSPDWTQTINVFSWYDVRFLSLRTLLLLVICLGAGFLCLALGPWMHESDQASFLQGAIRLAEGKASPWAAGFYNYDKQFASYWLIALAHRALPQVDLILLGNALSFGVFWSGVLAWSSRASMRSAHQMTACLACVVAPAFWLHSPFLASAFLSAGLLLWAWSLWTGSRKRPSLAVLAVGAAVLAVGCRVDAILLFPLLAWLITPASDIFRLLRRPKPYLLAAAGATMLLLGRLISTGQIVDVHPPFFYPKVFAAFLAFGLGGAALVVIATTWGLARVAYKRRRRHTMIFYALGVATLLLPVAYYSVQLFSPRYWVLTLCAQLLLLGSRRGGRLMHLSSRSPSGVLAVCFLLVAFVPIVLGIKAPQISRPRLVPCDPTFFPSADGWIPMGAFGWYTLAHFQKSAGIDHNHATWLAACSVDYRREADGTVPLFPSALVTYAELAVEMQGKKSRIVSPNHVFFYVDARQIFREGNALSGTVDLSREQTRSLGLQPASPAFNGYQMLLATKDGVSAPDLVRGMALTRAFAGAEFSPPSTALDEQLATAARDGKTAVLFSNARVSVITRSGGRSEELESREIPDLGQVIRLTASQCLGARVRDTGPVTIVLSRLPTYMNLQNL